MIIYSKTYDFTTKLLLNLKASQSIYNKDKIIIPFKNFEVNLVVEKEMVKTKKKLIITVLSMLLLICGIYPFYKLTNYKKDIFHKYIFKWNNNKLFFLFDFILFIMYHFMKKGHEVVRKIKGGERFELHFFHMYNIAMIRAFDPNLALFPDTNVVVKITNNTNDTNYIRLIETSLKT